MICFTCGRFGHRRESCSFGCSASEFQAEVNPTSQNPQQPENRRLEQTPAASTAEEGFGPWMLVNRRQNRIRPPQRSSQRLSQRSDFIEQRHTPKHSNRMTIASSSGQASRFAVIRDLETEEQMTLDDGSGKLESDVHPDGLTNSARQAFNRKDKPSLGKSLVQVKRKDATRFFEGQKAEGSLRSKSVYKIKEAKYSSGPSKQFVGDGPSNVGEILG
ncbi:hypothetical protein K1719_001111 [Acacia pycnantha]|nr:hypothetical protein K1719_001111 [Acacia pycnantha]